ncbi:DUF3592 domain-containing protein [Persicirhabdus sediminis]|uniref:DUF3592 domain-containing protein n=1 Tax=Persicirhabdus sediminis TaxID=454144 RepID=A0A8J7MAW7_9BACT|nr:DUF3592 domain-containing protein [Persicirhabdus sediminis]MBK1789621.1 DUF3592 domain-containing protein [Persicirhabdus sediminis]
MNTKNIKRAEKKPPLLLMVLLGSVFVGSGCVAIFLMIFFQMSSLEIEKWPQLEAEVTKSYVKIRPQNDQPFELQLKYQYERAGINYESSYFSKQGSKSKDYTQIWRQSQDYAVGTSVLAYVNPADPTEAYLHAGGLGWMNLFILIPMSFVFVGVFVICVARSQHGHARLLAAGESPVDSPLSLSLPEKYTWLIGGLTGVVLLAIGIAVIFGFGVRGWQQAEAAKSWQATPCKVIWSQLRSHAGDDRETYSVDIFYRYHWEGQAYRSNRYDFSSSSSSGYEAKKALTERYGKSSEHICLVNPAKPWQSVIVANGDYWFGFIIGAVIALIGGGVIVKFAAVGVKKFQREQVLPEPSASQNPYLA